MDSNLKGFSKAGAIMRRVDIHLQSLGLEVHKNYSWSLQGPTLIYLGEKDPFKTLTVGDVRVIKELGAKFLIEP